MDTSVVEKKWESTYHANVDFDRGCYPEGVGVPRLIGLQDQTLVDVPRAHAAHGGDQKAETEERYDSCALLAWHRQLTSTQHEPSKTEEKGH